MQAVGLHKLHIALQCFVNLRRVLSGLLQGVDNCFGAAVAQDFPVLFVGLQDGAEPPVFDLQHLDAPARVHDAKVWVGVTRTHRHVIPKQVVVIELLLKPLGQAAFAVGHTRYARAHRRNKSRHQPATTRKNLLPHHAVKRLVGCT